jgi:Tfp pilus assembly protein PilE
MQSRKRGFTIIEYFIIGTAVIFAIVAVYYGLPR